MPDANAPLVPAPTPPGREKTASPAREKTAARSPGQPPVVLPDDPRHAALVEGRNRRWRGRPREVVVCSEAGAVEEAVGRAAARGWPITVRGRGHGCEGFGIENEGGLLLDLSPMDRIAFDRQSGRLTVDAGAALGRVHERLFTEHGLALPAASHSSLGIVGHVLGAGHGPLSRRHGLSIDFLHAVDMVVVDRGGRPTRIHAARDSPHKELRRLLWAHQGAGGGHFGVVTRCTFADLPAAPIEARRIVLGWDWSSLDLPRFSALVRSFGECFAQPPGSAPPFPTLFSSLSLNQRAAGQIGLTVLDLGPDSEALDRFLDTMCRAAGPPTHLSPPPSDRPPEPLAWPALLRALDGSGPDRRYKIRALYLKRPLAEEQIPVLWVYLGESLANPSARLVLDSHGGSINAIPHDTTACPHRDSVLALRLESAWDDSRRDADHLRWHRDFYRALFGRRGPWPDDRIEGCAVQFPDRDLADWEYLYYRDLYPSLRRIKARWDPGNHFRHPQSIRLPSSLATSRGSDILSS